MNALEQLGERIAEQAAHLDAATHRLLTDLREFDACGGWHVQGAETCAHWLAWRVGWDLVTARDRIRVARKLAEFALIDDALRRGEVSYSKVRAVLRVATPATEALLLDHARLMTASQLEKTCRKLALVQQHAKDDHPQVDEQRRYVRRRDLEDGMVKIEAVLHPDEAELVWAMLDHATIRLAREAASVAGKTASLDSAESRPVASVDSGDAETRGAETVDGADMRALGSVAAGGSADVESRHPGSAGRADPGPDQTGTSGDADASARQAMAAGTSAGMGAQGASSIARAGQAAAGLESLSARDSAESPVAAALCRTATGAAAATSVMSQTSAAGSFS